MKKAIWPAKRPGKRSLVSEALVPMLRLRGPLFSKEIKELLGSTPPAYSTLCIHNIRRLIIPGTGVGYKQVKTGHKGRLTIYFLDGQEELVWEKLVSIYGKPASNKQRDILVALGLHHTQIVGTLQ